MNKSFKEEKGRKKTILSPLVPTGTKVCVNSNTNSINQINDVYLFFIPLNTSCQPHGSGGGESHDMNTDRNGDMDKDGVM